MNGETRGREDGEMGRWGDGEMGGHGDAGTRRWGDKVDKGYIPNSQFPIPNSQTTNNK
ncbi:MAG: hypothetical protein F6K47_14625 [Symploca sp. SIO2E6]|nr:hypothetical protein [Symploca sp. SIO2E6]